MNNDDTIPLTPQERTERQATFNKNNTPVSQEDGREKEFDAYLKTLMTQKTSS